MSDTTITFVCARNGNAFMNELLQAVAYEASAAGARTEVQFDAFPEDDGRAYVFVPHEFYACVSPHGFPSQRQLARTVAFCTEQPGTAWFDESARHAAAAGAAFDINEGGVEELRRRGVRAEPFRIGYSTYWDRWAGDESRERPIDVLHLGAVNARRSRLLASYAATLWPRKTRILLPPEAPKVGGRADFVVGEEKWALLGSSRILLNVHRQESPYFEWVRAVEAIANGCVIVSEHSTDHFPLVAGEHFASGDAGGLAHVADGLLSSPDALRGMQRAAYELIRDELPMRPAAESLAETAERVSRRRRAPRTRSRPHPVGAVTGPLRAARHRRADRAFRAGMERAFADPTVANLIRSTQVTEKRLKTASAALKRLSLDGIAARRLLGEHLAAGDPASRVPVVLAETPAYRRVKPRVTVFVPLYNYVHHVETALASIEAASFEPLELLILDDASTDGSADAVKAYLARRPTLPAKLLRRSVNRGLGRTRNELVERARGEYVFALDADNEVYPTAITRLVEALDDDPEATFAYTMLEEHSNGESIGLRSSLPWEPLRLQDGNYIDAMALLRREHVLELGGYSEDLRLYGWEDYELWLKCIQAGKYGVLVPEILCRYRVSPSSMLAITDIDADETDTRALLSSRYAVRATL